MSSLNQELKALIANLFECDINELTDDIGPGEVEGWDSLGHVSLMAEILDQMNVHIAVEDAIEVESIADIERLIGEAQEA